MDETIPIQNQLPTEEGYDLYGRLMADYARLSPQHQGLTQEDFTIAVADPNVAKTEVSDGGETALIPQLAPVETNQWLNADFYAKAFPEEHANGNVLNFIDIPGVEPGLEVQERLKKLADTGGVVVFDYPTIDAEYPNRVQGLLDQLGIETEDMQTLGNQTYFAGQSTFKRPTDPNAPKLTLQEAYEALVAEGKHDPANKDGASLQTHVDPAQARHMQQFYDAAYEVLNDHPCRQGLDPQEFTNMVLDRDWVTKAVTSVDGEVQAICLFDDHLSELSWVNTDYYKEHYPDKAAAGELLWCPGLAADPNKKINNNLQAIADLISEVVDKGNSNPILVFDCCDMNTGFLDAALNTYINNTPYMAIDIQPIAVQRYCAVKIKPKQ